MKKSIVREIPGIGPVLFERSLRARRVSISIRPVRGIRVAVPTGTSFKKAERFVRSKTEWIVKHLEKARRSGENSENLLRRMGEINGNEAKSKLIRRLHVLAQENGFDFGRVFIRNQKTLWGSCSGRNNINLNRKLAVLPDDLIDYVILHELVHTRIKNHSREFWEELEKYVRDAKSQRKKLKNFELR